ncbi:MAG: nitric-oxide reductase large subunit [Lautropia sp.]|nr:nitric-oxide reductase large subunit [Lautropia sp.]
MKEYKRLWVILAIILIGSFTVLGYFGKEVYNGRPPIPSAFVSESGKIIYSEQDIHDGQSAWQSIGGMSVGSVWGHGAYQAPDWSADWLHREVLGWLDQQAQRQYGKAFAQLSDRDKATLSYDSKVAFRKNTYDPVTRRVTLSDDRIRSIMANAAYYDRLFGNDPALRSTRSDYAMKENTLADPEKRAKLNAFIFWSAWAASTNRPGLNVTYTNNWPHEPLIGNEPTPENVIWSIASVVTLIFGIGTIIWIWAFFTHQQHVEVEAPSRDPLTLISLTPSQKALGKYLLVVAALFLVQVLLGGATAHYTVEGQNFYGIPLSEYLPYSLTRTWHIQASIFWIATGFLAAGLFLVPIINGGRDPKFQKLGVNVLFWALIVVVAGSFLGQFIALKGWMSSQLNFWFGHQGYEYVELGRIWQIALFIGLVLWLVLMLRGIIGALRVPGDKSLLVLFTLAAISIGVFYAPALFYGEQTHISIMEYWRWWVVHLWVEGFFEVFATCSVGFIFYNLGVVSKHTATTASLLAAMLFLIGGIPGTFHHLYFSGTTTPITAIGAMFSALEVVPLVLLGYDAFENWTVQHKAIWMAPMRWPLMFFISVSFWNMVGAGVFGFLINPPISLYYLQGLNTAPNHGHAALFGVYGFLALGFSLMVLRYIRPSLRLNDRLMGISFVALNLGLALMLFTSLLPIGIIQANASISVGLWWARSAEFIHQTPIIHTLRWVRTIGDMIFIAGAAAYGLQMVIGLTHKESGSTPAKTSASVQTS